MAARISFPARPGALAEVARVGGGAEPADAGTAIEIRLDGVPVRSLNWRGNESFAVATGAPAPAAPVQVIVRTGTQERDVARAAEAFQRMAVSPPGGLDHEQLRAVGFWWSAWLRGGGRIEP